MRAEFLKTLKTGATLDRTEVQEPMLEMEIALVGENAWELNEPPTLRGRRLASVPGVADRFPIAGPPSEKFAIQSYQAHHRA